MISSGAGTASGPSCSMTCWRWCWSSALLAPSPVQDTSRTDPGSSPNSFSTASRNRSEERNRSPTQSTSTALPPRRDAVHGLAQGGAHPHRVVGLPDIAPEDSPIGAALYRAPGSFHDVLFRGALRAAQSEHG